MSNEEGDDVDKIVNVSDPGYNAIVPFGDMSRPLGLERALIIRGLRGGYLIFDPAAGQVYRPLRARIEGYDDFVCETLNLQWALHDRFGTMVADKRSGFRRPCMGYADLRPHTGLHMFRKEDMLRLYLRHRLRLRTVLARSTEFSAAFFRWLCKEHFPLANAAEIEGECTWTLRSMKESLKRAAEDGILFARGGVGQFGPDHQVFIGGGSVRRDNSRELCPEFSSASLDNLHRYAACYEWTHWSAVLDALGFVRPAVHQMLQYMEHNQFAQPDSGRRLRRYFG